MPAGAPPRAARLFTSDPGCVTVTQAVSSDAQFEGVAARGGKKDARVDRRAKSLHL